MVRVIILVIYHSIEIKMTAVKQSFFPFRDSGGIQTHNLLIRSQMLYSVELRNPVPWNDCKHQEVIPAGFKPTTF